MFNIFKKGQKVHSPKTGNIVEFVQENPGIIIDVRTEGEYEEGSIKEALTEFDYSSGEFETKLDFLDKDKTYYLYCRSGNRSGKAAQLMKEKGFEDVHNIGGYNGLVEAGFEKK